MQPYQQLEKSWAEFNDLDPTGMVACASGSAALHLGLEAMHLPLGGEVITPDLTMIACARAVTLAGLTPVFVDCGNDLNIDADLVDSAYTVNTSALMVVHVYGRRCNTEMLARWASYNIPGCADSAVPIIEDLAEAHGVRPHPETDAACWSFYSNKLVAGQEGGAVWFRDPAHAVLARQLRSLGFTDAHDFMHIPRGHNYRMSNVHAELVLDSLANYIADLPGYGPTWRREVESWYIDACPVEWLMPPRDAAWVFDMKIPGMTKIQQNAIVCSLRNIGIQVRHGFVPMSHQEEYKNCRVIGKGNAGRLSEQVIYLPVQRSATKQSVLNEFSAIYSALKI